MVAYQVQSGNQQEEIFGLSESEAVSIFLKNCSTKRDVSLGAIIRVGNLYFSTSKVAQTYGYSVNNRLRLVKPS